MTVLDLHDVETAPGGGPKSSPPAPRHPASRGFLVRTAVAAGLTAVAYIPLYGELLAGALHGSRTAFLLVVPVLIAMIACSYRTPPRGVADAESDWIVAALAGSAGFLVIYLIDDRMPTLAGLWHLPLLGAVVWFACLLTIMFGVRHVVRMWTLWLFAACCATPLPYLLITAALGGSDAAAVVTASGFGAIAVGLSCRTAPPRARVVAALTCLPVAVGVGVFAIPHAGLLAGTVLAGGAIPLATVLLHNFRFPARPVGAGYPSSALPQRSAPSVAVLVLISVALMLVNSPTGQPVSQAAPASDRAWQGSPVKTFPFITRYLGAGSRFERYEVPAHLGTPAAAVDVITAPSAAALNDVADAVWYPSARPVDHHPVASDRMPLGARVIHTNADTARNGTDAHWYAVTWTWDTGSAHQQVTVIVSQSAGQAPPEPAPLSLAAISLRPALWLARQQPASTGQVDEQVLQRAADVVASVTADADADTGDDGTADA